MSAKNGKPCIKCGANEWNKRGDCLPCHRNRKSHWQKDNPEKTAAYVRRWAKKNPEKNAERVRRWARENPEKRAEKDRRWARENPERKTEKGRMWARGNPDKTAAIASRRKTRKTKAGGSFTTAEWNALVKYYGNKCLCCGRSDVKLTVDHIVPVAKGGTSNIDNIQPLCGRCNSGKRDKTIDYRPDAGLGRWIQRKLFG